MSGDRTVIDALAQILVMAIEYVCYRTIMAVMALLFVTPLYFTISYLVVNAVLIFFIVSKYGQRFVKWIANGLYRVYGNKKSQAFA